MRDNPTNQTNPFDPHEDFDVFGDFPRKTVWAFNIGAILGFLMQLAILAGIVVAIIWGWGQL